MTICCIRASSTERYVKFGKLTIISPGRQTPILGADRYVGICGWSRGGETGVCTRLASHSRTLVVMIAVTLVACAIVCAKLCIG